MIGIKMDMPESCDNCKFCIDNGYLTSQCRFHFQTVEDLRLNKVDKDCPLVDLGADEEKIIHTDRSFYQMYQIIKSLVGDQK